MGNKLIVFVSSVIDGMEAERKATWSSIGRIWLTRPWLFEHTPASPLPLAESYLSKMRVCDIFVLLLKDNVTDPVKAEVRTAKAAERPILAFLWKGAPQDVVNYARSLDLKYAEFDSVDNLFRAVAEAVGDELIAGCHRHRLSGADQGVIADFLKSIRFAGRYWKEPFGEPEWTVVPSGEFWMGEGEQAHRVFLDEYSIARGPVTNAQYRLFVESAGYGVPRRWEGGRPPRGLESHPVVYVTWFDALEYCRWLSRVKGKPITLPSEAEWEKAARGDKDQRVYPWGDTFDAKRCNSRELGPYKTTPVGMFPEGASPYGCLGMSGNVWEWTRSLYGEYPYPEDRKGRQKRENLEAPKEAWRVVRGGSFDRCGNLVRCACCHGYLPDLGHDDCGFRVAVSPFSGGL